MDTSEIWLSKIAKLRVDRASGDPAPHKPLLLLVILGFAEEGELPSDKMVLTPELAFRFYTYWTVVAHRRRQRPDVRFPFHYLQSDGFWSVKNEHGEPCESFRTSRYAVLAPELVALANDPAWRKRARNILIAKYFRPEERIALYSMLGLALPPDDQIAQDATYSDDEHALERGREARFRLLVIPAYNYTCALTGYRLTTIASGSIVDAAHIHQFADSRNNHPANGLALSKNAHWQFDRGLWSISDDYEVIVATSHFSESSPDSRPLSEYEGYKLRLPRDRAFWPDLAHLAWHRKHRFLGGV